MLQVGSKRARLRVWDTAGQERFRTLSTSYFRKAQGAMMVYDVSDRRSFDSIAAWLEQLHEHGDKHSAIVLCANKADLPASERKVSTAEGKELAATMGIPFFEVSAKSGKGVEDAFRGLASDAITKGEAAVEAAGADTIDVDKPPQPSKCPCVVM
jgi:small GTP-binding protein